MRKYLVIVGGFVLAFGLICAAYQEPQGSEAPTPEAETETVDGEEATEPAADEAVEPLTDEQEEPEAAAGEPGSDEAGRKEAPATGMQPLEIVVTVVVPVVGLGFTAWRMLTANRRRMELIQEVRAAAELASVCQETPSGG